jgi:hypothetical protein
MTSSYRECRAIVPRKVEFEKTVVSHCLNIELASSTEFAWPQEVSITPQLERAER